MDDSPLDAERVEQVLRSTYSVRTFPDGASVLEVLGTGITPDVLVLDWVLPGVSGVDVCRFLRGPGGSAPELGILLLTAQRETSQIVEGLRAGANDYVAKPFSDEELLARVASLVRTRELFDRVARAEAFNLSLLESAPDALLALDAAGRIAFANEEATRVLGKTSAELKGRPLSDVVPELKLPDSDGADGRVVALPDVKRSGRVFAPSARFYPRPSPPPPPAPKPEAVVAATLALRDVTEGRRAETRKLDFYSIVSHDLRSPINAVLMRVELMRRGHHGELSTRHAADLDRIDKSLKDVVHLVNDFLDWNRLESGVFRLERTRLDLNEVVAEAVREAAPIADSLGLAVSAEPLDAPALVLGDRRRIGQALGNLLANAVKFTPRGGAIVVRVRARPDAFEVSVEDNGPGIAAEVLPHLFEKFVRAVGDAARVPGAGLGLMIVREIVDAHGGTTGVESTVGKGSSFWIRLPHAPAGPSPRPAP